MKTYLSKLLPVLALILPSTVMALSPGEGIVRDQNTGDYVISYLGVGGQLMQSRFEPSTKIDPTLRSAFENQDGLIRYRYSIRNGIKGKQPLIGFELETVSSIQSGASLPKTWQEADHVMRKLEADPEGLGKLISEANSAVERPNGWSCRAQPIGSTTWAGFRISCSFDNLDDGKHNGLQIGETLTGIGFFSPDLPGIGEGHFSGFGDMGPSFMDEGPSKEISDQLNELQKNDFVIRGAVVPAIAVPVPFDAPVLLDRIRNQMLSWTGKHLLDPAFATQLDRQMVAAGNAYRGNQVRAGKEDIETVRKMLAKEHRYLDNDDDDSEDTAEHKTATRLTIDRLAARVLDFDLRYVLKRMENEHEHEHDGDDRRKEQERK